MYHHNNPSRPLWSQSLLATALCLSPFIAEAETRAGNVSQVVQSQWGNQAQLQLNLENPFAEPAKYWELEFDHTGPIQIWNAQLVSQNGNHYRYRQPDYEIAWVDYGMPSGAQKNVGMIITEGALSNLKVSLVDVAGGQTTSTTHTSPSTNLALGTVEMTGNDWYKSLSIKHLGGDAVQSWTLQFRYGGQLAAGDFWGIQHFKSLGNGLYEITVNAPSWKATGFMSGDIAQLGVNVDGQHTLSDFVLNGEAINTNSNASQNNTDTTQTDTNNSSNTDHSASDSTPEASDDSTLTSSDESNTNADPVNHDHHSDTGAAPEHGKRVVGYFTSWGIYARDYQVADIPADRLTHINYAFININGSSLTCEIGDPWADTDKVFGAENGLPAMSWDESVTPIDERGNFGRFLQLKEKYPHLKTLMSIGGWTWSQHFSDAALTDSSRQNFVSSCVAMMQKYGFNGIDVDWEYPVGGGLDSNTYRPEDKQNYTLLMQEFRQQLNALQQQTQKTYLLTIAAPAGYDKFTNMELSKLADTLDFINIMTYDFHGAWETRTNHHAALYPNPSNPASLFIRQRYNTDYAVQRYLAAGVPADKLVVGLPFYARAWQGVDCSQNQGLYQLGTGPANGTWEKGNYDYWDVMAKVPASSIYFDEHAEAAYACHNGIFYTFDTPVSIANKVDYVKYHGLGGVMFWELSGDVRDSQSQQNLLKVINDNL